MLFAEQVPGSYVALLPPEGSGNSKMGLTLEKLVQQVFLRGVRYAFLMSVRKVDDSGDFVKLNRKEKQKMLQLFRSLRKKAGMKEMPWMDGMNDED